MKRILLGLLALSATVMATSTGVTGSTGDNQIDITTKAFIVDSGLIITDSSTGTTAIKSVDLDHGTLMKGTSADSSVNRNIYIRKTNGNSFPDGAVLEIGLNSVSNDLTTADSNGSVIPHILTATIDSSASGVNDEVLELSSTTKGDKDQFTVGSGKDAVGVNLKSDITSGSLGEAGLAEGAYSNTSTLSVKYSKLPQAPGVNARN